MRKITSLALTMLIGLSVACTSSNAQQEWASNPPPESNISLGKTCFDMSPEACEVFYLTNVERQKQGLPEMKYSRLCFQMSQEQSEDMAKRGYFDHTRPSSNEQPGESFSDRAKRFGLSKGVGENIAKTRTAAQTVQMWMNSAGHRKNILNPTYKSFAVGYQDGLYTQVFWVNEESQ